MLQVYYPAETVAPHSYAPYTSPEYLAFLKEELITFGKELGDVDQPKLNQLDSLTSHSLENVIISSSKSNYPIILFAPSWGAPVYQYSTILEELASHGYIVIGINFPYRTDPVILPENRIIIGEKVPEGADEDARQKRTLQRLKEQDIWIQDIQFVLDEIEKWNTKADSRFFQKMDLAHIGIFGHSFGGSVAAEVCRLDQRCSAGVVVDSRLWYQENSMEMLEYNKPLMFILSGAHSERTKKSIQDVFERIKVPTYLVDIPTADHFSFMDVFLLAYWQKFSDEVKLEPIKGVNITRILLTDFFDRYLKNNIDSQLALFNISSKYPEIDIKARNLED